MNFLGLPELEAHDRGVFAEVVSQDTYGFKTWFRSVRLVWDIGGHIGHSAWWASQCFRNSTIFSFEPNRERFELNKANAAAAGDAWIPVWAAVYGNSLDKLGALISGPPEHVENSLRYIADSPQLSVIEAIEAHGIPDILKIDCEGFESGILVELAELGVLDRIPYVTGEWHFEQAKRIVKDTLGSPRQLTVVEQGDWNHFRSVAPAGAGGS